MMRFICFLVGSGSLIGMMLLIRVILRGRIPAGVLCAQALLHEETHYRQKDHIWTTFRIFLCVIYWWNPLVWLGAGREVSD